MVYGFTFMLAGIACLLIALFMSCVYTAITEDKMYLKLSISAICFAIKTMAIVGVVMYIASHLIILT